MEKISASCDIKSMEEPMRCFHRGLYCTLRSKVHYKSEVADGESRSSVLKTQARPG